MDVKLWFGIEPKSSRHAIGKLPSLALDTGIHAGMTVLRCRSGFATPTETFEDFNSFQNVSDGVANPVTLQLLIQQRLKPLNANFFIKYLKLPMPDYAMANPVCLIYKAQVLRQWDDLRSDRP